MSVIIYFKTFYNTKDCIKVIAFNTKKVITSKDTFVALSKTYISQCQSTIMMNGVRNKLKSFLINLPAMIFLILKPLTQQMVRDLQIYKKMG